MFASAILHTKNSYLFDPLKKWGVADSIPGKCTPLQSPDPQLPEYTLLQGMECTSLVLSTPLLIIQWRV